MILHFRNSQLLTDVTLILQSNKFKIFQYNSLNILLLLLLALQPTVGFSLLSDSLPFRPFLTQLSPPSYSHYLYIFFDVLNPSFPWSSFVSPTCWFPLQYSFRYSFPFRPHQVTQPNHVFGFYKSHYICVFYWVVQLVIHSDSLNIQCKEILLQIGRKMYEIPGKNLFM